MRLKLAAALAVFASTCLATEPFGLGFSDTLQLNYLSNLQLGGSSITIMQSNFHGSSVPGVFICANIYVFAPDEALVSCCSCVLTGRGIISLSGASLLAGISPAPTTVSIRLIAALPTSNSCTNSAATIPSAFAAGMRAWSTHLVAGPPVSGV